MSSVKSNAERPLFDKSPSIAAVVVTYNRLALLQKCIAALEVQTRSVDEIIVVNNGSTDGTADWLRTQVKLTVVNQENLGSAGGQYTGIKTAYCKGHSWFWCMDDDTIPTPSALANFEAAKQFSDPTTGFLWSLVLQSNGEVDQAMATTDSLDWWGRVSSEHCIRVDHATFVSVLISRRSVSAVGFPLAWMFIWGEDFEFTRRIAGRFKGWAILDSRVIHLAVAKTVTTDLYDDINYRNRSLYRIRNEIVRIRIDPLTGGFGRLLALTNAVYQAVRLMRLGKMPVLKTLRWIAAGMFHRVRFEFPESDQN